MRKQLAVFLLRLVMNAFGLWVAAHLLTGHITDTGATLVSFLLAGLILSVANTLLRPIVIILSLPAILLTLGLFMLVVNGFMVYLALNLLPSISISFPSAVLAAIIIGLINYVISGIIEISERPKGANIA
ncbi:MAG TPA: phage holin family protein [Candidatus Saccharimonadales bacterium]|nr:phage holin family protein [Candidatus Saccharimonadales bacterium]